MGQHPIRKTKKKVYMADPHSPRGSQIMLVAESATNHNMAKLLSGLERKYESAILLTANLRKKQNQISQNLNFLFFISFVFITFLLASEILFRSDIYFSTIDSDLKQRKKK